MESCPTFEDLSIDDNLTTLERMLIYCCSNIALQRLVHVKMFTETCELIGYEETTQSLLPLIPTILDDAEYVVRQTMAEQIAGLAQFCVTASPTNGYRTLIEVLLPAIARLVADQKVEVRSAAGATLVSCCKLLRPSDIGQHGLTIALRLAHDDDHEEMRMTAAGILNEMADCVGPDLCQQFLVPELVSLSEDPVFRVRKAAALSLHGVARTAGPNDAGRRLLPAYVRLSKDDMYRVRKACAENLVEVSRTLDEKTREDQLVKVFLRLVEDNSWIVRHSALYGLGQFISTLPQRAVDERLVNHFTGMAIDHKSGQIQSEQELREKCAFAFPAVCVKLGKDRWQELSAAYRCLTKDRQLVVRKTLAHSLHIIASVLPDSVVESELLDPFTAFIRDCEEVRAGVVKKLASFYSNLLPATRNTLLPVVNEILQLTSLLDWRGRHLLATQLQQLSLLYESALVETHLVPLVLRLMHDPVFEVRQEVYKALSEVIKATSSQKQTKETTSTNSLVASIQELAEETSYQKRQMYILICEQLAHQMDKKLFEMDFLHLYASLESDKVVSVRIALARSFHRIPEWLFESQDIQDAISKLKQDCCADVVFFANEACSVVNRKRNCKIKSSEVVSKAIACDHSFPLNKVT